MDPTSWDAPFWAIATGLFLIVMARANGTYWLGRLAARGARRTRIAHAMRSAAYERAVERVTRWGAPVVTVSFVTVGLQTLVLLAAGALRMPLRRFLPAVVAGSIVWALLYATVGFVGFEAVGRLWAHSPALTVGLGALLVVGVGLALATRRSRSPRPARAVEDCQA